VIVDLLKKKAAEEKFDIEVEVFTLVARQATGSLRDGISLLDQLASTNQKVTLQLAESVLGTAAATSVVVLTSHLMSKNLAEGLNQIQKALDSGTDARQLARQMVDYLRNVLLVQSGNSALVDTTQEIRDTMVKQADVFSQRDLLHAINQFNLAAGDSRSNSWQPGLAMELAFARSIQGEPVVAKPHAARIDWL
jgi:DNA polymerase-3 subunit gamma/tau